MHVNEEKQKKSTLTLRDRHTLTLDGVCDVVSFDEGAVILHTELGTLTVEGKGLHILSLDLESGGVTVEGSISALFYTEKSAGGKGGFFSRMVH